MFNIYCLPFHESIETRVPYYKFEFRAIVFGFKRNLYVEINKCLLLSLMHGIRLNIVMTSVLLEPYLVTCVPNG